MREIKFRAWDKEEKEMLELVTVGCTRKDSWGPLYIKDKIINGFDHRNYDIMQYTGLKDKNGVEIYEGDIVRRKDFVCDEVYFNVGQISYSGVGVFAGQFIFKSQSGNLEDMYSRYGDEVIGNVHENLELLEVAE